MKLSKTAVCKLKPSNNEQEKLLNTLKSFREACNYISEVAYAQKIFNPVALHHITYRETRNKFGLPANLAIRARDRVSKAYKQRRDQLIKFDKLSMDLDERLFRLIYKPEGIYASISTLQKRVKVLLDIGEYQRKLIENVKPTHAVLVCKNGNFFLHIVVSKTIPDPKGNNPVGVDVGMKNLIIASNGFKEGGLKILKKRQHFRELRSSLQSKGTASAKRKLKRLSGRERRWMNAILHKVSREFVNSLKEGDKVVMEDLTKIRDRAKHRKEQNADFHSWAFRRLQFFICYKALERGIPVVFTEPKNTSITCPRCGIIDKANRRTQSLFRCVQCGFQHNADYIASLNLSRFERARSGLADVNQPNAGIPLVSLASSRL